MIWWQALAQENAAFDGAISEAELIAIIGLISAPFAAFTSWLLGRGQRKRDKSTSSVSAANDAVEALQRAMTELREENMRLRNRRLTNGQDK